MEPPLPPPPVGSGPQPGQTGKDRRRRASFAGWQLAKPTPTLTGNRDQDVSTTRHYSQRRCCRLRIVYYVCTIPALSRPPKTTPVFADLKAHPTTPLSRSFYLAFLWSLRPFVRKDEGGQVGGVEKAVGCRQLQQTNVRACVENSELQPCPNPQG